MRTEIHIWHTKLIPFLPTFLLEKLLEDIKIIDSEMCTERMSSNASGWLRNALKRKDDNLYITHLENAMIGILMHSEHHWKWYVKDVIEEYAKRMRNDLAGKVDSDYVIDEAVKNVTGLYDYIFSNSRLVWKDHKNVNSLVSRYNCLSAWHNDRLLVQEFFILQNMYDRSQLHVSDWEIIRDACVEKYDIGNILNHKMW